jgi:WD40 repeat protein
MPRRRVLLLLLASLILAGDPTVRGEPAAAPPDKPKPAPPAKPTRTDLYGDPLPEGALARFGTLYLKTDFTDLAFRADGREFYSWHQDGLLRVHDAATGKVLRAFRLPPPVHTGGRFSSNGRFITLGVPREVYYGTAKALTVWETTTGKLLHRIESKPGDFFSRWEVSLHDGRTVVTCDSESGAVRVWNLQKGTHRVIRESSKQIVRLDLSPDGKQLFVQGRESIQCWDMADGKRLWEYRTEGSLIAVAPDGRALLVYEEKGADAPLRLLDPDIGKPRPGLKPPKTKDWRLKWGSDGRTLLAPDDEGKFWRIWDLVTGKERARFPWYYPGIMAPDGKSFLGVDTALQRWDVRTKKPLYPSTIDRGHSHSVWELACSTDGKLLASVEFRGSLYVWDLHMSRPIHVIRDPDCASVAFTPDGNRLIAATIDESVVVYNPTSGKVLKRLRLENLPERLRGFRHMVLPDSKKLILGAHLRGLSVRAWSSGPGSVTAAWDLETGKRQWVRTVEGIEGISGISPDGRWGVDWDLRLRELETGRLIGRLAEKDAQGPAANHGTEFSPDGALVATDSSRSSKPAPFTDFKDSGIQLWERATCRLLRRLPIAGWRLSFAFAPDGRRLAVLRYDELWVWDVARGKALLHAKAPGNVAYWRGTQLSFVPNGQGLLVGTDDGSILLFAVPPVAPPTPAVLSDALLRQAWDALADPDPARAFLAAADLADRPSQAVPLLKERLKPAAPPVAADQLRRLIVTLDDDDFASREAAQKKLAALGPRAWPALRKALVGRPSVEAKRRLELLLQAEKRPPSADVLRNQRALRALEWAGTAQARDLLAKLASGDPDDSLTQEAKAALGRLQRTRRPSHH